MTALVVVAPLREGAHARARELLDLGPPFDLAETAFDRHEVFLSENEVVFVFEGRSEQGATLALPAEATDLWRAAGAWADCLAGRPRIARSVFSWERG
ncbi:MAG: hypothetical protein ABI649_00535 [Gaiellaceae bacterium]